MPSAMLIVPSGTPRWLPSPWWNASHGPSPRPERAMHAMPIPKPTIPTSNPGRRRRMTAGCQRSRIARW